MTGGVGLSAAGRAQATRAEHALRGEWGCWACVLAGPRAVEAGPGRRERARAGPKRGFAWAERGESVGGLGWSLGLGQTWVEAGLPGVGFGLWFFFLFIFYFLYY